ncbi:MAG: 4'-phosphopantetheinyl transferase superfamily protein [Acholeplasmatales bacterium]|nr:4'-phosphopantetheinyl transferase superfamily protein [Acholeplasmatales bacterium]
MINLYIYELDNMKEVELPDNLSLHCNKYTLEHSRLVSRYAYSLLVKILENANYNPKLITFTNDGKPVHPHISFSISHSKNYIAIAISEKSVGVDVEGIFLDERLKMAQKILTLEELDVFNHKLDQNGYLTEKWTLKEAYAKFLGTGLIQKVLQTTVEGISINVKGAVVSVYPKDTLKMYYENREIY